MKTFVTFAAATCVAALLGSGAALAASDAEVTAIIRSLAPIAGQTVTPGYPGQNGDQDAVPDPGPADDTAGDPAPPPNADPVPVDVDDTTIYVDYAYSLELEVYFPFDSAELTPRAATQLEALGEALEDPQLKPFSYLVAGHTDAKGNAGYNQALSLRRAQSVKAFLIENYAIDPYRLEVLGWGEGRLKTPDQPLAAVNRRVEVTLIVPDGGLPAMTGMDDGDAPAGDVADDGGEAKDAETPPAAAVQPSAQAPAQPAAQPPVAVQPPAVQPVATPPAAAQQAAPVAAPQTAPAAQPDAAGAVPPRPGTIQEGPDGQLKITW